MRLPRTLKRLVYSLGFNIVALYVTIELLEGVTYTGGWQFFVVTGFVIGFLNFFIKPLLKFLSIPLIFFTGGLFLILLNGIILWLTDNLLEILDFTSIDFQIEGVVNFVFAGVIFGITNWFAHWFLKRTR
jgi:putative membrane protein